MGAFCTNLVLCILLSTTLVYCDYDCVCNHGLETKVFRTPNQRGQAIGYLYGSDCKPKALGHQVTNRFYAIQFEKQLGYVNTDQTNLQILTCLGNASDVDLIPATLPASSQTSVSPATTVMTTTPKHHWYSANVTGTPYQYVGVGYNILTGNPESMTNQGLDTAGRIFQLTGNADSVLEATKHEFRTCTPSVSTFFLHGSKSYQDELKSFVKTTSQVVKLQETAFTLSADFKALKASLDDANVVYLDFVTTCTLGNARYLTEDTDKNGFTVTLEFAQDVCALPTQFNSSEYMRFLDKWGTNIVTAVEVGTRIVVRYQTTLNQLFQKVQQTRPDLLVHTGSYHGYPSITINTKAFSNSPVDGGYFGVGQQTSVGSKMHPVPITYKIVPIYEALNWSYWQPIIDDLTAEGICSDSLYGAGMNHYVNNIKTLLSHYSEYKTTGPSHTALTDYQLQFPITWPRGTYGLMQTAQGCPGTNSHWSTGWRGYDTEDVRSDNKYSTGINRFLKGEFASNNIKTYFCIKTSQTTSAHDQTWQKGTYCLLKYGNCPTGFSSGYIYWDDEDLNNDNSKGGTLPDGTYDKNTKIYYCCRHDASHQIPIFLPTDRPFILLRYGNSCQSVHGMQVRDLYVKWDDEDLGNKDSTGGMHPLDDGGSDDHRLHFCYYFSSSGPSLIG